MTETRRIPPDGGGLHSGADRIRVSIRMLIPGRMRKEALSILSSMMERTKLEEGCLSCRLYQDVMGGRSLMFEEIWGDENRFKKHLRSEEFRNVLLVVEMASKPPEIRFDRIAQSTGIDTIETVRKRAESRHDTVS